MILSIGIDSVEIKRFKNWHKYSTNQLKKIFSQQEINYCLKINNKIAERFAVRFAAKEATFKALNQLVEPISFIKACKLIEITNNLQNAPTLKINYKSLKLYSQLESSKISALISLTHNQTNATAIILLQYLS